MIEIRDIRKSYRMGDTVLEVLRGVSLKIEPGDFVAIMGPSGSGKSTLMHILGLLDAPSSGSYRLNQKEVAHLTEDELAIVRRQSVGFVFQQFNLLPRLTAAQNVALPLLYSHGTPTTDPADALLGQVGLRERTGHRPTELSGGQQQRVAIARALINKPQIIFADEPTGNLDSKSEKEIMALLRQLHAEGITVVIVTHEEEIGQQADRLIRLRDGLVVSDERSAPLKGAPRLPVATTEGPSTSYNLLEHVHQGLRTLAANKVRTALSMLGVLIGVASVVAMLALGRGAQQSMEAQMAGLGSNLLTLRPGGLRVGGVAMEAGSISRLTAADAQALIERIPEIEDVSPQVYGRGQITYANKNWSSNLLGVTSQYARIRASTPERGRFFTEEEDRMRAKVAVIGMTVVRELFGEKNPVGQTIKVNKISFLVIGILPEKGSTGWRDQDDQVVVPLSTAMYRVLGKDYVDSVDIEVRTAAAMDKVTEETLALMLARHRVAPSQRDDAYEVRNMADIQKAVSQMGQTMSLLLASIAAISLLVGGIGIMNIMLVSVTERTKEIGLRKAVGARRSDILMQFLAESVVVSVVGGLGGILLGWLITVALSSLAGWATSITLGSVLLSTFFSGLIGVGFGIYPARRASALAPIDALRYE